MHYSYPKACAGLNFIASASLLLLPAKAWLLQQPPSTGLATCPQVWESYLEKFAELKQFQGKTIADGVLMLPLKKHGNKALVQDLPCNWAAALQFWSPKEKILPEHSGVIPHSGKGKQHRNLSASYLHLQLHPVPPFGPKRVLFHPGSFLIPWELSPGQPVESTMPEGLSRAFSFPSFTKFQESQQTAALF